VILGYHSELCYVEMCEFDSLNFYAYMFHGVLFGAPQFSQLYRKGNDMMWDFFIVNQVARKQFVVHGQC
jgi:hypothetical protein